MKYTGKVIVIQWARQGNRWDSLEELNQQVPAIVGGRVSLSDLAWNSKCKILPHYAVNYIILRGTREGVPCGTERITKARAPELVGYARKARGKSCLREVAICG